MREIAFRRKDAVVCQRKVVLGCTSVVHARHNIETCGYASVKAHVATHISSISTEFLPNHGPTVREEKKFDNGPGKTLRVCTDTFP